MRKILYIIICMPLLLLLACDVHEWPELPKPVKLNLTLRYETEMIKWEHLYDGESVVEQGLGDRYDNHQALGQIRYIIRTYPVTEKLRTAQEYTQEFIFTKDISEGYDHEVEVEILPGDYTIMVWSDLVESSEDVHFYGAENFASIMLQGAHQGNSNYRDAFCGKASVSIPTKDDNQADRAMSIEMKRPLAKFEIVASDLLEFVKVKGSNLELYKAKIQYVGFMPNVYSLFADRPIASTTGEMFESSFAELNDSQDPKATMVSMGFDYVFVGESGTMITIRVGIYDNQDRQISISEPITIPVKPDHHTLLRGEFLMQNTSNGVTIDPGWSGDHNIIL